MAVEDQCLEYSRLYEHTAMDYFFLHRRIRSSGASCGHGSGGCWYLTQGYGRYFANVKRGVGVEERIFFRESEKNADILAQRFYSGQRVILGYNKFAVDLGGGKVEFACVSAGSEFVVPKAGEWYAVTTRPFLFAFGMGNLVEYRVKDFAKQTFFLGLFGQATCSVVHLRGFQRWMRGQVCVTRESLARALYDCLLYTSKRNLAGGISTRCGRG